MAALDMTTPAFLPYIKRATLATTFTQIDLPANHGDLTLSIRVDALGGRVSFDPSLSDGDAVGADYETLTADAVYQWDIPSTQRTGVVAVFLASVSGTPSASIEISRVGPL